MIIPIQRIDENLIIIDIARCLGIFLFKVLLIELCFFLEAFFKESPLKSVSKKHFFKYQKHFIKVLLNGLLIFEDISLRHTIRKKVIVNIYCLDLRLYMSILSIEMNNNDIYNLFKPIMTYIKFVEFFHDLYNRILTDNL